MDSLGRVAALWRYPVKSMGGETLQSLTVDTRGALGDRVLALRDGDGKLGSGKASKRFRAIEGLLDFAVEMREGAVVIRFPDGRVLSAEDPAIDAALSAACGIDVRLVRETNAPHHDSAPLHILSEGSLGWLRERVPAAAIDARRFRPNVVVAAAEPGAVEQDWIDRSIAIDDEVVIAIRKPTARCVMTTMPQPGLGADPSILRVVNAANAGCLGVYAEVLRGGTLRIGDVLRFI